MAIHTLRDLLLHELRDLYSAERQMVETLPRLIHAAHNSDLKEAFQHHFEETNEQIDRLETAFELLNESSGDEHCEAMEGLIREAEEIMAEDGPPDVKDAALIAAAQRVEHYEIAAYGSARSFADHLDMDDIADLLDDTLDEESNADSKLTKIATGGLFRSGLNREASSR